MFTAPKGTRQNDSGAQRMGNYFYFDVAGAVADSEEDGGGAWVHVSPLGHRKGHIPWDTSRGPFFGLERAIPKGLILASKLPF